jgi:hypothetical protein
MDNIDDIRNSIVISLATCGGIVTECDKGRSIKLTISYPNPNKTDLEKEIFKTYIISRKLLKELEYEAYELHAQIDEMILEEENKKVEDNKKRLENEKKKDEQRKPKDIKHKKKPHIGEK